MDRAAVQAWLVERYDVSRETLSKLDRYVALLLEENARQNLIARSTEADVWDRHIRDSAQLFGLAPAAHQRGRWLDLGSGPGLPGIVLAILGVGSIRLVESRRKRAEFLDRAIAELALGNAGVEATRLEKLARFRADVVTARAFAPLPRLLVLAAPFTGRDTLWLLPKGQTVEDKLAEARRLWHGDFETVQSATDPRSSIVRASGVRRRG